MTETDQTPATESADYTLPDELTGNEEFHINAFELIFDDLMKTIGSIGHQSGEVIREISTPVRKEIALRRLASSSDEQLEQKNDIRQQTFKYLQLEKEAAELIKTRDAQSAQKEIAAQEQILKELQLDATELTTAWDELVEQEKETTLKDVRRMIAIISSVIGPGITYASTSSAIDAVNQFTKVGEVNSETSLAVGLFFATLVLLGATMTASLAFLDTITVDRWRRREQNIETIQRLAKVDKRLPRYFHEKFGIRNFARYPITFFINQWNLHQEMSSIKDSEPTKYPILHIQASSDQNDAFHTINVPTSPTSLFLKHKKREIDVLGIEVRSKEELHKRVKWLKEQGYKFSNCIVAAHGTQFTQLLSDGDKKENLALMDDKTLEIFLEINDMLLPEAQFFLDSCSTQKGSTNIATWIQDTTGRHTQGLPFDTRSRFSIDSVGNLKMSAKKRKT